MKSSLRAFGIGLFVAGATIALVDLFSIEAVSEQKDIAIYEQQLKDYENQITLLTEQLKEQNATTETGTGTNTSKKPEKQTIEQTNRSEETVNSQEVTEGTIYIYEDVSIYTIGQQAEDLGIVSNGRELELFLSKPDYARSIQKGAFELNSDMTIEQMAKVLTGQSIE